MQLMRSYKDLLRRKWLWGLRGVLKILAASGCSLQSEDEVMKGRDLVVNGGCAGWERQSDVAYLRKC